MRCDVALRDLGPSRAKVELNDLALCRGKSDVSQTIEHVRAGGVCGRTSLNSTQAMFDGRRQTSPKVRLSHKVGTKNIHGT